MIKFLQFIQWCGRKILKGVVSLIFGIPAGIGKAFRLLKHAVRYETFFLSALWLLSTILLFILTIALSIGIETWFSIKYMPYMNITESVFAISFSLYAILAVGAIYDIFQEEQEELMNVLKK